MNLIKRLTNLIKRKSAAHTFGLKFVRAAKWKIPSNITISGRIVPISSPHDIGSDNAFLDIFLDDCYALNAFARQGINSVMDVGAHIGLFSSFARVKFPNATIHAYEPNPEMMEFLPTQAKNFSFNVFNEAVGSVDGFIEIVKDADSVNTVAKESSTGAIKKVAFGNAVERLGNVDLLKLDCEGAEWDIFKSEKKYWNKVRNLTMEYHLIAGKTQKDVIDAVTGLGFKVLLVQETGPTWGLLHATKV